MALECFMQKSPQNGKTIRTSLSFGKKFCTLLRFSSLRVEGGSRMFSTAKILLYMREFSSAWTDLCKNSSKFSLMLELDDGFEKNN